VKPVKPLTVEKKIGGEKNGETRIVLLKKRRNYHPTADKYELNVYFVMCKLYDYLVIYFMTVKYRIVIGFSEGFRYL
jgi:hypothetical protein